MSDSSKFKLRKEYTARRSKISKKYYQTAADSAANIFAKEALFSKHHHIACYLPIHDEFDTHPLINAIWQAKKKCYVPVLTEEKMLLFVRYDYGDALQKNRFGILEPINTQRKIALTELDIVITPLIAFDLYGHRLGTGGGYYDRTFAFLQQGLQIKPHMIGIGFALQEAEDLPHDPWDILLEAILTEEKFLLTRKN